MKHNFAPTFLSFSILLVVGSLTAILFSHSALLSGDTGSLHIDSQVYIHTARQILQGKILYKEVFDHKGPIMYCVECMGVLFCGQTYLGLWISQWIFFVLGVSPLFIFWAKKYNPFLSIIALVFMISWVFRTKTIGDNLPEIYSVSLIALSYYFALKIIESKNESSLLSILLGASAMGLFLIKPNLIVVVLPALFWSLYSLSICPRLLSKWSAVISLLKNGIIGASITLLPFVMYFAYQHALSDALFAFWTFNLSYISAQKLSLIESISQVFCNPPNYFIIFILSAAIVKVILIKEARLLLMILLFSVLISIMILVGIPGRGAESFHYAISLAPLLAWLVISIGIHFQRFQLLLFFAAALYFFRPVLVHLLSYQSPIYVESSAIQFINTHKKNNETLCIIGNRSAVYEQTNSPCNTPFFYTYPIMENCKSAINESFLRQFDAKKADWVLHEIQYTMDSCVTNILNDYKLVYSNGKEQLYQLR